MSGDARPLAVLHIDTERGWRGGERQALWLAEGLVRRGHRSVVAARPDEPLAMRAAQKGIPVAESEPITEVDPVAAARLRRVIRRGRIDIVHAHTGHAVALGALATLATGAKLVLTRRVDFRLNRNLFTRWKYARAHGIIAISRAIAEIMAQGGVARDRIHVVHSGIDLRRRVEPATVATLEALGVPAGAPLVVQVAALVPHKDPVTFVRAIDVARRRVPSVRALMVGEGELRPAVEGAVADAALETSVRLTGYRTDADSLLAAADVVSLSSREEGMGSVLADALALGKPIVACAAGGIPEVVEDGVSGILVPVGDHAALGEAVARVLTDGALAERLAAGARERAALFSIDRTVDRTIEVYRQALAAAR